MISIKWKWAESKASITKLSKHSIGPPKKIILNFCCPSFPSRLNNSWIVRLFFWLESLRALTQLETWCTSPQQKVAGYIHEYMEYVIKIMETVISP